MIKYIFDEKLILVDKKTKLVATIYKILDNEGIILEIDDDGTLLNDNQLYGDGLPEEIFKYWDIWQPGMIIKDRTGKGMFCNKFNNWQPFYGVPEKFIEEEILKQQNPWICLIASTNRINKLQFKSE